MTRVYLVTAHNSAVVLFSPLAMKATKRTGMYVRCDADEKKRIKEQARRSRRSLSDYCMLAILKQLEHDEANTRKG